VNLTGARTPGERVRLLVASVVPARDIPDPGRLVDIGSGNGSPGLVLALLRDDLDVTLLEPRARRWAFLRDAARAAGRAVDVRRERHDEHAGPPARTLTLRALALPLVELVPLVEPGGRVVFFGGHPREGGPFERTSEGEGRPGGLVVFRRAPVVPRET
jgi:16S rRNA (guanine527-N7)-methyltransferase